MQPVSPLEILSGDTLTNLKNMTDAELVDFQHQAMARGKPGVFNWFSTLYCGFKRGPKRSTVDGWVYKTNPLELLRCSATNRSSLWKSI